MREVAHHLLESGVGIIQLPCPELGHLGLDRQRSSDNNEVTMEAEDDRVAQRMNRPEALAYCGSLADQIVQIVKEYRENEFEVCGVLGINGSPTCGVETNWSNGRETVGPGVFIKSIQARLQRDGRPLAMLGVKAQSPDLSISAARALIECSTATSRTKLSEE
jgi:predicted secreted protein